MGNFHDLWRERLKRFVNYLGKHLKFIMNDHFTIVLFVILGFFSLYYREQILTLQTLEKSRILLPIILIAALVLSLNRWLGRPLWLMKEADRSFVFSQGDNWKNHWLKGTLAGFLIPAMINGLLVLALIPIMNLVFPLTYLEMIALSLMQGVALVRAHLFHYQALMTTKTTSPQKFVNGIAYFLCLLLGMWYLGTRTFMVIGGILTLELIIVIISLKKKPSWLNFQWAIDKDLERQSLVNKRLSFFVEIPNEQNTVVERKYFNYLIHRWSLKTVSPMEYALIRVLFRNKAYSGVWARLLLFTSVIIIFSPYYWMTAMFGSVAMYLTIVQLLPMIHHYDYHPLFRIYPKHESLAQRSFQTMMMVLLILQSITFMLVSFVTKMQIFERFFVYGLWALMILFLRYVYIPIKTRSKKD